MPLAARRLLSHLRVAGGLLLAAAVGSAAACGSGVPEDGYSEMRAATAGEATGRFGLVVLTYSENRDNWRVRNQLNGAAWFVEHTDVGQRDVLRLLNVPLVTSRAPANIDSCEVRVRELGAGVVGGGHAFEDGGGDGAVYFMDAGEVTLDSGDEGFALDSAWFPDVYPEVDGLVYEGTLQNGLSFMSQPEVRVTGHGSGQIGPFAVELTPPEPLRMHAVAGRAVVGHRVAAGHALAQSDEDVEITWSAPAQDGNGLVVIELTRRGYDRTATLACTAADDGAFALPRALVERLPDFGRDQTDRLSVVRFQTAPFEVEGLDEGQVLLLARDSVLVD